MIAISIMCIVLLLGFIGIGSWAYRFTSTQSHTIGWTFWLGWAMTIGILQIWHFFAPINNTTRIILLIIAGLSLVINHRYLIQAIAPITSLKIIWGIITLIISLWLVNRATFSSEHFSAFGFDSGFYHIPVIKWFSEHPVILGLANVHTRFGFSNAFFLYGALVNWDIFIGKAYQIVNTLLYIVLLSQMTYSLLTLFQRDEHHLEHYFRVLCLPFVILWLLYRYEENLGVPSTSNDVPIFMLGILLAGRLIRHIEQHDITLADLVEIGILVGVGITIKFNFIFGAGLLILAFGMYAMRHHRQIWRGIIWMIIIGSIFFVPMMWRSIWMTGYPLFPLTIGGLDVDWRVPEGVAHQETEYIQIFARTLGNTLMFESLFNNPNLEWFTYWRESSSQEYPALFYSGFILAGIGILGWLISRIVSSSRHQTIHRTSGWWIGLLGVGVLSVLFWFINAPLWRLSVGVTWFLGACICVLGIRRLRQGISTVIVMTFFIGMSWFILADGIQRRGVVLDIVPPHPMPDPILWVEPSTTYSGTTVYVAQNWLCWNYTIPCVPKPIFTPLLRERVHGDISQGYRTTQVAMPIDASQRRIKLAHETFSALTIDYPTSFEIIVRQHDDTIINRATTIQPLHFDDRNEISYGAVLGALDLPELPQGTYHIQGRWGNINLNIANVWQVHPFIFEDKLRVTDALLITDDNRTHIQLVGEGLQIIPSRYHTAIWLRGEHGIFQRDVSPIVPTHDWAVGDRYLITTYFDDLPSGRYDISIVWYDIFSPTLSRLQGFDEAGNLLGDVVTILSDVDL